jgi:anti-sigma factor RsiW
MTELTCKELVELITEYLEGNMSQDEKLRFESHLATCSGCTNYLEQMRKTILITGKLREESLLPGQKQDLITLFRDWKKK